MTTWRAYGAGVLVSAGILITGTLLYDKYPTGETAAELAGAAWERAVVARHTGSNAPAFWYNIASVSTNITTNITATVTIAHASGSDPVTFSPSTLSFSATNWQAQQTVTITRKTPWVSGTGQYDVKYNGTTEARMAALAYFDPSTPSGGDGSFIGTNVAFSPLVAYLGGTPLQASFAVLYAPTSGTVEVITTVRTNYTGMAAISPYMRNDQLRYFLDALRGTVQDAEAETSGEGQIWWIDAETDFDALLSAGEITSYATPEFTETTNRWSYTASANKVYPTGGVYWARNVAGTGIAATPRVYTLGSFLLPTNSVLMNAFGWASGYATNSAGEAVFVPSAVFPFAMAAASSETIGSAASLTNIGTSYLPWASGSWWLSSGMHTNTQWQLLGDEYVVSGAVKRSSWPTANTYARGRTASAACSRTLALISPSVFTNTVLTEKSYSADLLAGTSASYTNAYTNSLRWVLTDGKALLAEAEWDQEQAYEYSDYTGITYSDYDFDEETWEWDGPTATYAGGVSLTNFSTHEDSKSTYGAVLSGAVLTYPSKYAVDNGYVARVRVYAVYVAERDNVSLPFATAVGRLYAQPSGSASGGNGDPVELQDFPETWSSVWTSSAGIQNTGFRVVDDDPDDYFGLSLYPQVYNPDPDFGLDAGGSQVGKATGGHRHAGLAAVRLTKILDVSGAGVKYPIALPDIGPATGVSVPTSADYDGYVDATFSVTFTDYVEYVFLDWLRTEEGTRVDHDFWSRKFTRRQLYMNPRLVVVVDWAWKHMNPDSPFVPETYTPGWLSTNAP